MIWISILVFLLVLLVVVGGYFLLGVGRAERAEVKKRISLLELRNLQRSRHPGSPEERTAERHPAAEPLLSHLNIAVQIDRRLQQADMNIRVGTFVLLSPDPLCLGGSPPAISCTGPRSSRSSSAPCSFTIPNLIVNVKRRLRVKRFMNHFPDALEMFARSLRAGHSFTGAIQLVAQEMPDPIGPSSGRCSRSRTSGSRCGRPSSGCRNGSMPSTSSSSSRRS